MGPGSVRLRVSHQHRLRRSDPSARPERIVRHSAGCALLAPCVPAGPRPGPLPPQRVPLQHGCVYPGHEPPGPPRYEPTMLSAAHLPLNSDAQLTQRAPLAQVRARHQNAFSLGTSTPANRSPAEILLEVITARRFPPPSSTSCLAASPPSSSKHTDELELGHTPLNKSRLFPQYLFKTLA